MRQGASATGWPRSSRLIGRSCSSRKASHEHDAGTWLPEPLIGTGPAEGPEQQAVLADSVSMALLVVLEALTPAERLAFVLHDIFKVPFSQIAPVVERTPQATRQLASRARRRVQQAPLPDPDPGQQRQVVDAFLAAARHGDFDALVAVLDPSVVFRADLGPGSLRRPLHGAHPVARRVLVLAPRFVSLVTPITINGAAGALFGSPRDPIAVTAFTVTGGRISAIDLISDPGKLRTLTFPRSARQPGQAD
jgi:RNA polymerase sigma-70 factor (ECF subfamily)